MDNPFDQFDPDTQGAGGGEAPPSNPFDEIDSAPVGLRNNNPGNLRPTSDKWQGMTGQSGGFLEFDTPENGIRALARNLQTKSSKYGLNTIAGVIGDPHHGWAPANENDTQGYIADVAKWMGVDPHAPLNLQDPATLSKFTTAIMRKENGGNVPYSQQQVMAGIGGASPNPFDRVDGQTQTPPPAPQQPQPAPAQPPDTGALGMLESGNLAAMRSVGRLFNDIGNTLPPEIQQFGRQIGAIAEANPFLPGADIAGGVALSSQAAKLPQPAPTVQTSPVEWDKPNLRTFGEKLGYQILASSPELAAGAVAGPLGAGVMQFGTSFAENYDKEIAQNPKDPNGAFENASKQAGMDAAFMAAGWKLFDVKIFKGAFKNLLAQGLAVQPAIAVAQQSVQNYMDGKPLEAGIPEAYLQGATSQTLLMTIGHLPGAIRRGLVARTEANRGAGGPPPPPPPPGPSGPSGAPGEAAEARRQAMLASVGLKPAANPPGPDDRGPPGAPVAMPPEARGVAPGPIGPDGVPLSAGGRAAPTPGGARIAGRRGPDAGVETLIPAPEPTAALAGSGGIPTRPLGEDLAYTAAGRPVRVQYALVEANHLVPSQTEDGAPNPNYPAELQPRDRSRLVSQNQVAQIAQNLNPRLLDKTAGAGDGAPVVASSGIVESGNGRTLALQRAYREGMPSADQYREYLAAQGYPVEGMKAPVLVRVRTEDMSPADRQAFVREANQPSQMGYSATERAMADARALPDESLDLYRGGDVEQAGNRDFVRSFMRAVVPETEQAQMFDKQGALSQDAGRRMRNALFAKAYGDPDLTAKVAESADSETKAIGGALTDAAPDWAKMRNAAANGTIPATLDQTSQLLEAARIVAKARAEGQNLTDLVGQKEMFGADRVDPDVEGWLALMFRDRDKWKGPVGRAKLGDAIRRYAQQASQAQAGPNLLGTEPLTAAEILENARKRQYAPAELPSFEEARAPSPGKRDRGNGGAGAGSGTEGEGAGAGPGFAQPGGQRAFAPGEVEQGMYGPRPPRGSFEFRDVPERGRTVALSDEAVKHIAATGADLARPDSAIPAAAEYISRRGATTGEESFLLWDSRDGRVHAVTQGLPDKIDFDMGASNLLRDGAAVTIHNHPSSSSFSQADVRSLNLAGHRLMAVVTPLGHWYAARLKAARALGGYAGEPGQAEAIHAAYSAADATVRSRLQPLVTKGLLDRDVAGRIHFDLVNRALAHSGVTDYLTSNEEGRSRPESQAIIQEAANAAAQAADNVKATRQPGAGPALIRDARAGQDPYRWPESLRFGDGIARLLEAAGIGGPVRSGRAGRAGEGAALPRGKPEQLRLLEDKDRYKTEPGAVDAQGRPLPQTIIPGAEGSAIELAKAREAAGKGLKTTKAAQKEPGGLFGPPKVKHPDLFEEEKNPYEAVAGGGGNGAEPPSGGEPPSEFSFGGDKPTSIGDWFSAKYGEHGAPLVKAAKMLVSPMTAGTPETMATAKDFANLGRYASDVGNRLATAVKKGFTPAERKRMFLALDEQEVARRRGESTQGIGVARLEPKEADRVDALVADQNDAWESARAVGLVTGANAEGGHAPHVALEIANTGLRTAGEGRVRDLPGIGRNVRTTIPQLKGRKYETIEEMEQALSRRTGKQYEGVRDIAVLPVVTAQLRKAVAGRELLNAIKEYGERSGTQTVSIGSDPGGGFFHLNHPSFFQWEPEYTTIKEPPQGALPGAERNLAQPDRTGTVEPKVDQNGDTVFKKVPIYVHPDWEGPLRAIMSSEVESNAIYRATMALKEKSMHNIMFSPLVQLHLMTEIGRSLPAAPMGFLPYAKFENGNLKVGALRIFFDGFRAKNDPVIRREAIMHGLVPIGRRGFMQNLTDVMAPEQAGKVSWTARVVGAIPWVVDKTVGTQSHLAVYDAIAKTGNFLHNTMLWDRVADLQFGLYKELKAEALRKGMSNEAASYLAAHWGNRFAGTLPHEAMSGFSRAFANLSLFSRTYTLGNLGVFKDMVTGLPQDVQAQIARDGNIGELEKARSLGRRKTIGTAIIDTALLTFAANSLLQNFFAYVQGRQDKDQIIQGYIDRAYALGKFAMTHPLAALNPFTDMERLSATAENEIDPMTGMPLKRIRVGTEDNGTAIYMRNPLGKFAEEFGNWSESPSGVLYSKLSTFARPTIDLMRGKDSFGRPLYNADDPAVVAGAKVAQHYIAAQLPMDILTAGWNLAKDKAPDLQYLKLAGRAVGITTRQGYPGGPAGGEVARLRSEQNAQIGEQMPAISEMIKNRDIQGARAAMRKLGMNGGEINYIVRSTLNPQLRLKTKASERLIRNAPADVRERIQEEMGQ